MKKFLTQFFSFLRSSSTLSDSCCPFESVEPERKKGQHILLFLSHFLFTAFFFIFIYSRPHTYSSESEKRKIFRSLSLNPQKEQKIISEKEENWPCLHHHHRLSVKWKKKEKVIFDYFFFCPPIHMCMWRRKN